MSDARRTALRDRVAALSDGGRRALADALADAARARDAARLVAYVVFERGPEVTAAGALPTDEQLRAFLAERLPEHMIPARIAMLERLPRTAAGKLDRRALEREAGTDLAAAARAIVAPRTPTEVTLAGIWRDVLRLDEVSVHDDFFEVGGDSLLSIRMIARAGRAGLKIPVERFFEHPTIARLAAAVDDGATGDTAGTTRENAARVEQGDITGEAPLTPIQHWFLDAITDHRDHWNQSYLLEVAPAVDRVALAAVVRTLVAHHDTLRLRLVSRDGEWRQDFQPVSAQVPLRTVDLSADDPATYPERVAAECEREQTSLRLGEGGLFRCVSFEGARGWRRLLLLAHHVVVDGVSWEVLLEDVAALLALAERAAPLRLPPKTCSAREWAVRLAREAATSDVAASAQHWLGLPDGARSPVPVDLDGPQGGNRAGDAARCTVTLDDRESTRLLTDAASRHGASPQGLLLAALLLAWRSWTGQRELVLDVEGHGRDALGDALDVSRTVGWFTTVFPVRLAGPDAPAEVVRAVRSTLSALPLRGASHGLLRWMGPDEGLRRALGRRPRPEVLFNYLGVRGAPFPPGSPVRLAAEPDGRTRSPDGPRAYVLEINARVDAGRLTLDIEYSRRLHRPDSVERLADALRSALRTVAAPSSPDFALAGLDASALSTVADLLAEADDA